MQYRARAAARLTDRSAAQPLARAIASIR